MGRRKRGAPGRTTLAVVGAGRAAAVHVATARALGMAVAEVATRRGDADAEVLAAEAGGRAVAMWELSGRADIVIVATPPASHREVALRALKGGAAVIVEHPLALTLDDADALVAAAGPDGGRVAYAEPLAYAPLVRELLRRAPALGPLADLEARAVQDHPRSDGARSPAWGGGALVDLAAEPLALVLLVARPARPVAVQATLGLDPTGAVDDHAELEVRFDDGLRARVVASWRGGPAPVWDLQAAGERGVLRAELLPHPLLEHDGEPVALPPARTAEPALDHYGALNQLASFVEDFAAGRAPFMDVAFGRSVVEVLAAAASSAGTGGVEVALPFTGPHDQTPLALWRGP